jgi:hypothetical protein
MTTIINLKIALADISNIESLPKNIKDYIKATTQTYLSFGNIEGWGADFSWSALYEYWSEEEVKNHLKYNPDLKVGYKISSIGIVHNGKRITWSLNKK